MKKQRVGIHSASKILSGRGLPSSARATKELGYDRKIVSEIAEKFFRKFRNELLEIDQKSEGRNTHLEIMRLLAGLSVAEILEMSNYGQMKAKWERERDGGNNPRQAERGMFKSVINRLKLAEKKSGSTEIAPLLKAFKDGSNSFALLRLCEDLADALGV